MRGGGPVDLRFPFPNRGIIRSPEWLSCRADRSQSQTRLFLAPVRKVNGEMPSRVEPTRQCQWAWHMLVTTRPCMSLLSYRLFPRSVFSPGLSQWPGFSCEVTAVYSFPCQAILLWAKEKHEQ